MKFAIFIAVFFVANVCAQNSIVHWLNFDKAISNAQIEPKLIFVDLYADWCVPCRIMEATVYADSSVAKILNNKFYAVKLNADSKDSIICDNVHSTVQRCYYDVWELSALPAFVLIAPKGLSILTVTQSMNVAELKHMLELFLQKETEWISR